MNVLGTEGKTVGVKRGFMQLSSPDIEVIMARVQIHLKNFIFYNNSSIYLEIKYTIIIIIEEINQE